MSQISPDSAVALRRVLMRRMCLTAVTAFFLGALFWTLPNLTLNASAAAVSIGLINMDANLAGYLGTHTTGWLRSRGFGDGACLLFFATRYLPEGGVLVSFVKIPHGAMAPLAPPQPQMS